MRMLQAKGKKRIYWTVAVFMLLLLLLICRLYYLQIISHNLMQEKVAAQIKRTVKLEARRGNIFDRHGSLLATTVEAYSVIADPYLIKNKRDLAESLAGLINLPAADILRKISVNSRYALIKRKILPAEFEKIKGLGFSGIFLQKEQQRVYLQGQLFSHVVGYVDQENQGQAGVELSMAKYLQGLPGSVIVERDLLGTDIYTGDKIINKPQDGYSVVLTIDEFLQYVAHRELKKAIDKYQAEGGTLVIMDVESGDVLALVSLPDYDPAKYYKYPAINRRNDVVQTVYEPGSIFKLITVAAALDSGVVDVDSTFINGNVFEHGTRVIREAHPIDEPQRLRNVSDIIVESLNIGAAKLGLKLGKEPLAQKIKEFKFGKPTGIYLPGESAGIVRDVADWHESDEAIIPFGQAIAVTPLQMIAAVNAIANDGYYVAPRIVKKVVDNSGRNIKDFSGEFVAQRIVSAETAAKLKEMMVGVIKKGSGSSARLLGYSIGGKTGTSQKPDLQGGKGYKRGDYWSSFAGVLPIGKAKITVLVVINSPKDKYYGSTVAVPVFKAIADEAVRYLIIPPDEPTN